MLRRIGKRPVRIDRTRQQRLDSIETSLRLNGSAVLPPGTNRTAVKQEMQRRLVRPVYLKKNIISTKPDEGA
jgi:hypothetical protein